MTVSFRRADEGDAAELGRICFEAFKAIAEAHNYPPDFPSPEVAAGLLGMMIGHEGWFETVAVADGKIIGSNFLDERGPITGVGPITVDPAAQDEGLGRLMMEQVIARSHARGFDGIRLVQAGYHRRSLALYLKLGFDVREHLTAFAGPAIGQAPPGFDVRPMTAADTAACNQLCVRVHGHDRGGEVADAAAQGDATVVRRDGRITGYATRIGMFGHAVAETTEDLQALIAAQETPLGPFLAPTRNSELMRWCFEKGLRIVMPMTLMSMGFYQEPKGAWLPSILY